VPPRELHFINRMGWLRAAVLGANDGIVSTGSLVIGVAAAASSREDIMIAGIAGLVAGAMSMAAGEYVSVSSQADSERADLEREKIALATNPEFEHQELTSIYIDRGLEPDLAAKVAEQLMIKDALGAHARDELGISETIQTNPIQAALVSGASFSVGAALPLISVTISPDSLVIWGTTTACLISLAILGSLSARTGGAPPVIAATRVTLWGALAMAATAAVGHLFGVTLA